MADEQDQALYVGEAGYRLVDGTELIPHVTVANVGWHEANGSELWQPLGQAPADAAEPDPEPEPEPEAEPEAHEPYDPDEHEAYG